MRSRLLFRLVGVVPQDIIDQIKKYHLDGIFEIESFVSRTKAIKIMHDSDALLLFTDLSPNNKAVLTGKLFEYLITQKPILAFAPIAGAASQVIKETESGVIIDCETQTKKEMIDGISSFIQNVLDERFKINNRQLIKKYYRKELTKKLAEILEKTILND